MQFPGSFAPAPGASAKSAFLRPHRKIIKTKGTMLKKSIGSLGSASGLNDVANVLVMALRPAIVGCGLVGLLVVSGCRTNQPPAFSDLGAGPGAGKDLAAALTNLPPLQGSGGIANGTNSMEPLVLREGDVVRVSFPGAPNLNTIAAIRRDGKASLPLIGEIQAAGLRPSELETKLVELYGPQLQVKEVSVALESSAFPIYVSGSVLRPGKIMSDRPLTALEAVMEAGGFDHAKANLKAVSVIRRAANGQLEYHTLNLKRAIQGRQIEPFLLKPSDIVYVPERFSWF